MAFVPCAPVRGARPQQAWPMLQLPAGPRDQHPRGGARNAAEREPAADAQTKTLYPYIVAGPTAVPFDMRKPPQDYEPQGYHLHARYSALSQPTKRMRFISPNLPWTIEIEGEWICCALIWDRIYESLQRHIRSSEWVLIAHSDVKRQEIEKARKKRLEQFPDDDPRPKRIDWLGEMTLFRGLQRDDALARRMLLPGRDECPNTYVIRWDSHWPRP
ncbi:hypothetical protein BDW22DRAFT_559793 [Trametopsis cervina]|nr:hypothetical protein BDW22DRAFT_559793 [Trametopsis cervina]